LDIGSITDEADKTFVSIENERKINIDERKRQRKEMRFKKTHWQQEQKEQKVFLLPKSCMFLKLSLIYEPLRHTRRNTHVGMDHGRKGFAMSIAALLMVSLIFSTIGTGKPTREALADNEIMVKLISMPEFETDGYISISSPKKLPKNKTKGGKARGKKDSSLGVLKEKGGDEEPRLSVQAKVKSSESGAELDLYIDQVTAQFKSGLISIGMQRPEVCKDMVVIFTITMSGQVDFDSVSVVEKKENTNMSLIVTGLVINLSLPPLPSQGREGGILTIEFNVMC
jgi:hypothetical protein